MLGDIGKRSISAGLYECLVWSALDAFANWIDNGPSAHLLDDKTPITVPNEYQVPTSLLE